MTQEEFGNALDDPANKGVVSHWEHGANTPSQARLKQIAKLGGISVQALVHGSYNYKKAQDAIYDTDNPELEAELNDYLFQTEVSAQIDQQTNLQMAQNLLTSLTKNQCQKYNKLSDDSKLALSSAIELIHQFEKPEPHEHTYDDVSSSICLSILLDNLNAFAQNPTRQSKRDVKQSFNQLLENLNQI